MPAVSAMGFALKVPVFVIATRIQQRFPMRKERASLI